MARPLPVIEDVFRYDIHWQTNTGWHAHNVLHFEAPGKTPAQVHTAFQANTVAAMFPGLWAGVWSGESFVTPLDGETATYQGTVTGSYSPGTGSGTECSPATALVVSFRTAKRGHRNRGRLYIPMISEASMANGQYTGTLTAANAAWVTWINAMKAAGVTPVIASYGFSRYLKGSPPHIEEHTWVPFSTAIVSATCEQALGTQRRRQARLRG